LNVLVYADESDGASVKLGVFQRASASNKGVAVLTGNEDFYSPGCFHFIYLFTYFSLMVLCFVNLFMLSETTMMD
jgi:hypothetical protein